MTSDKLRRMGIYLQYFGFLLCRWADEMQGREKRSRRHKEPRP
jgi:hypothetical protein